MPAWCCGVFLAVFCGKERGRVLVGPPSFSRWGKLQNSFVDQDKMFFVVLTRASGEATDGL